MPGKSGGGGAYPRGGSVGRREERSGTAAFTDGEGAPVVVVDCDEVLQIGRGKGVRKLQEIVMIGGSERSSPGNGGRWWRSAGIRAREGLPVVGGGGPSMGSGGKKCGAREGDRRGVGDGAADGVRVCFEWSIGGAAEGEKGRERGGPAAGVPRGAGRHRGAQPRPAGDVHRAHVAGRKQRGGDWQVGRCTVREREPHARARVRRPEKEKGGPSPTE
jgi:hypothetical protein